MPYKPLPPSLFYLPSQSPFYSLFFLLLWASCRSVYRSRISPHSKTLTDTINSLTKFKIRLYTQTRKQFRSVNSTKYFFGARLVRVAIDRIRNARGGLFIVVVVTELSKRDGGCWFIVVIVIIYIGGRGFGGRVYEEGDWLWMYVRWRIRVG